MNVAGRYAQMDLQMLAMTNGMSGSDYTDSEKSRVLGSYGNYTAGHLTNISVNGTDYSYNKDEGGYGYYEDSYNVTGETSMVDGIVQSRTFERIATWVSAGDFQNGGFISNRNDFISFMKDQARNNPVEVAAFGLNDGNYYVQSWKDNTKSKSINDINVPGYGPSNVISQYHTHPNSSGPSRADARFSNKYNIPVHSVSANGDIWQVFYPRGYMVPLYPEWMPYGGLINR